MLRGAGVVAFASSLSVLAPFVLVGALGLPDTSTAESLLRFPEIQHARAAENLLYLAGIVLWAVHYELLHRLPCDTSPVLSTAARTVALLGGAILSAGALLNVANASMSQAYQQAAQADRTTVVLAWQSAQGVLDAMLVTGALLQPVAVVLFGLALRRGLAPRLGWVAVAVGTAGLAGAVVAVLTPPSTLVAVAILATLVFHLAAGARWLQSTLS